MSDYPAGVWWNGAPLHENPEGIRVVPGWTVEEVRAHVTLARHEYELRRRPVRPKSRRNGR